MDFMDDCGCYFNEGTAFFAMPLLKNCYTAAAWKLRPYLVRTDTPSNTYCRAPATAEGIAIIENVIEHLCKVRNEDSLAFRLRNMAPGADGDALSRIIDQVRVSSDYDQRVVQVGYCIQCGW